MGIHDFLYKNPELPSRAVAVYFYLEDRANAKGECWPSIKRMAEELNSYLLRLGIRSNYIHSDIETFERVNTKGAKLNAQEIRNAINQGKSTELLNQLSNYYDNERKIVDKKRMKDKYLILRYFAMKFYYQQIKQGNNVEFGTISDYLSATMKKINAMGDSQIDEMKEDFIGTYDRAKSIFGTMAFKTYISSFNNFVIFFKE